LRKLWAAIKRGDPLRSVVPAFRRRKSSVFLLAGPAQISGPSNSGVRKNELRHLLDFRPASGPAGRAFLKSALARMESGHRAYTLENGGHAACGWATEGPVRLSLAYRDDELEVPARAAALYDFSSDCEGSTDLLLHAMLKDLLHSEGIDRIYAIGFDRHSQSFERAGFVRFSR